MSYYYSRSSRRADALLVAASVARCCALRRPLAMWHRATRDVAVRGAAVARRHKRLDTARLLSAWRARCEHNRRNTQRLQQKSDAMARTFLLKSVLHQWRAQLLAWRRLHFPPASLFLKNNRVSSPLKEDTYTTISTHTVSLV